MDYIDDKLLVREILSGNRTAFEKLIRQYEKLVLHIVTPLIGVNADREDICQDVFVKVYQKLATFQYRSKLSTWIGNIAYNTSINFLKKKRNVLAGDFFFETNEGYETNSFEQADVSSGPEEILIDKEKIHLLMAAIDNLPQIQKAILLLFHQDDLSLIDIATIVEMPLNTIKSHLFRARKTLKDQLS